MRDLSLHGTLGTRTAHTPGLGRALVVDSDPIWRGVVERALVAYGFCAVTAAASLEQARRELSGEEDVIVTEVVVAHETCLAFVASAVERSRRARIVAMSDRAPRPQVFRLRDCGVSAYLEKPFAASALHDCLEMLVRPVSRSSLTTAQAAAPQGPGAWDAIVEERLYAYRDRFLLTSAEVDVLRMLLGGMRRAEIARDRCISINTVKTQVRSILAKSGATNVRELRWAFMHAARSPAQDAMHT